MMEDIAAVRGFNRFHTKLVGALNEHLLLSEYSLPQVRVLYEIANAPIDEPYCARDLGQILGMDKGFLSRIVTKLEKNGLIKRVPSVDNAKRLRLTLTQSGKKEFEILNSKSANEVASLIQNLTKTQRREMVQSMNNIQRLLGEPIKPAPYHLRDPKPGDLGWITHQNGRLYADEYGWDWTFEALVAEIVGRFARNFDPRWERCWVAEREGQVIGSVFVMREDDDTARLRLLYVEKSARGLGLGQRLVAETLEFARKTGYKKMVLWTNDILVSARRIYQAAGFVLVDEEPHHSFGKDLIAQTWQCDL